MPPMRLFLRCVGEAVCANGLKALLSTIPLGEAMFDIAKDTYERLQRHAREQEALAAIAATAQATVEEARREAAAAVAEIRQQVELPPQAEEQLALYLERVPAAVRQSLRRPADPSGKTVPPAMILSRPEQLVGMLPSRLPRFRAGDRPAGVGNWELVELLGSGGFGEVWKAKHPTLEGIPPVALKFCLDDSAASALRHEAHLLSQVMQQANHPGFVPLRQAYLDAEPLCLEYEYVGGGDLVGLVNDWHKGKTPPRKQINSCLLSLAKIMAHAHGLTPPIVHRDLKPANILVQRAADGKFRLRVADFGIGGIAATQAVEKEKVTTARGMLTTSLRGSHTPLYASPQQQRGEAPDPRDDVHALGVIWYQMLTGDLSSGVPADWVVVLKELGQPPLLIELLGDCVASRPDRRIPHAGDLSERLEKLLKELEAGAIEAAPRVAPKPEPAKTEAPRTARVIAPAARREPDRDEAIAKKVPRATARQDRDEDERISSQRRVPRMEEDRPARRAKKEEGGNLPLILGGVGAGAVVLLLVVVGVVLALRPSKGTPPNPGGGGLSLFGTNGNNQGAKDGTKGGEAAATGARSADLPRGAVDLLPLIDLNKDVVNGQGKWAVVGRELHCKEGNLVPRVQIPYRPPQEYDFVVTYSQPKLRNGINLIMPKPGGGGSFAWALGGDGDLVGFQVHPNWDRFGLGTRFQANRKYTTAAEVRRDKIRGYLDGKPVMEIAADYKKLAIDTYWFSLKDPSLLGLTCDDPVVFESVYLIEVTGKGSRAR